MANELKIPHVIVSLTYMAVQAIIIVGYLDQVGLPNLSACKSILYELISENSFSEAVFFVYRQIYPHLCIVDQQNEIKNHVELKM